MNTIPRLDSYPEGAQYAMLTKDGMHVQTFYKEAEIQRNDGTKETRLLYIADFRIWQMSYFGTLENMLFHTRDFEVVSIQ
jgi:hypothetical protein